MHVTPSGVGHGWHVDPATAIMFTATTWCYARGTRTLWARAGRGRGISMGRVLSFGVGMATLFVALQSPIDSTAADLFAMHMVQHLLLMVVAAQLLLLGAPEHAFAWALPLRARRRLATFVKRGAPLRTVSEALLHPVVAFTLHAAAILLWHIPRAYDAAVRSPPLHILEHLTFLGTAVLYWWNVTSARRRRRMGMPAVVAYLFVAALGSTVLGALLSMARVPWYSAHLATSAPWGFTPVEDQQLAGILMWVPAGLVYLGVMLALAAGALRQPVAGTPARSLRYSG